MASTANASHGTCTLRCSVEKRSMCRDLQKWSKTLLCMIGLENVAERLVGRKKHLHRHGHHQTQPLQQHVVRISPFVEPLVLSSTQSQSGSGSDSQHIASYSDTEAKPSSPQDWDPKERCAICTQISEKEDLAKKAQAASSSSHSQQHSRSKKEHRSNADRAKEGGDGKGANRSDSSTSMATGSTQLPTGAGQQSSKQQQQVQSHLQHVIDWRSMNGGSGASGSSHPFGAMNMFRSAASAGQSSASSPFTSSGSLAASMFSPTGYPFFDLNQVYLNELLNQYSKMAAAVSGGTSTSSYNMISSLPMGVSSMPPPPPLPYSVSTAFSFPHLVASLGTQGTQGASSSAPTLTPDEPLDLSKKPFSTKKCASSGHCASSSSGPGDSGKASSSTGAINLAPSQSPPGTSGSKGPASNTSSNGSSASNPNKRTYSQADLQAAVDDIRSKKLGTRRASVVYGIPRSTLRNKIYKLEATDDDQCPSASATPGAPGSSSKSSSRKGDKSKTASDSAATSADQKMDESTQDHSVSVADTVCGRTTTSSEDSSASLSSSPSSSSCANESNAFSYVDSYNGNWTTAAAGLTAELAKRQAVEALWRSTAANGAARSVFSSDITSFPSPIMNGSAAVKNVLQDAVCCALTENLKLKGASLGMALDAAPSPVSLVSKTPKPSSSGKRSSSSRRRGSSSKANTSADRSPATMVKIDRPAQSASAGGGSSAAEDANDPSKKIRPKRGQYRKYDKNALAEAVHAVRRGEMSVHRAGSFYGVPHSTLEYKVKERNLLRPKKRDLKKKDDNGSGDGGAAAGTGSPHDDSSSPAKIPEPPANVKTESSAAPKPKSSRSTKSKRPKRPSQTVSSPVSTTRTASPISGDIFSSLFPAETTPTSLDLSASTIESPSKKSKKAATASNSSSPSSSSPSAPSNVGAANDDAASASDQPQASTEGGTSENSEYSTLKAYEAGFQAALLASDILHRLQMQTFTPSNENAATEPEGDKASESQPSKDLAATTE